MIDWDKITSSELELIQKITDRALKECDLDDTMTIEMDLSAAHLDHPLDLARLLAGDKMSFMHDIFGIRTHLNRDTGKLSNTFSPRFSHHYPDYNEIQEVRQAALEDLPLLKVQTKPAQELMEERLKEQR